MCMVISHNAGGYSFYKSPQYGRITRFRANGVPLDRPGHYVYLRDDDTGEYWSVSWQPVGKNLQKAHYECRHGLSYSKFSCKYRGIEAEQLMFIPLDDDVELWDVRIKNNSRHKRKLSVFSYAEFSLHNVRLDNEDFQMGLYASGTSYSGGIIDYDFFYGPGVHHFMASNFRPDSYDCVRDSFIGSYRSESNPVAVERGRCGNSVKLGGNHCGVLHKQIELGAGENKRIIFMLGPGKGSEQGRDIKKKYSRVSEVDRAFVSLGNYWRDKLSVLQCECPDEGMASSVNTWALYQAETCAVWSRFASFIEVGGRTGLGYRDTAQDAMSMVHTNPAKACQRICELLTGQTSAGFGLHLFEPEAMVGYGECQKIIEGEYGNVAGCKPDGTGETREASGQQAVLPTVVPGAKQSVEIDAKDLSDVCSDDALWLIETVCDYVKETGDVSFFDKVIPFADRGRASVYEHLKRALDFTAGQLGKNGICKGLRADWNDCLNLGGGESAMVSFIFYRALGIFIETARYLGRKDDVNRYKRIANKVKRACERQLWDGKWYLRGFTGSGVKIGTQEAREGKLFLNAQSWAVMSGVADAVRGREAMNAVNKHLYCRYGLHLLWPAYTQPDDSIGFVTRVYAGIKENASIFTHPNPWAVIAECILGRGERAFKFYRAMLGYYQNDMIEVRQAEPYSYCQFIIGKYHPDYGQARHPWLTGSAGWFYTAATRWILGIRPGYNGLIIDPCIPKSWEGFRVSRKWRGAVYNITVKNPDRVQTGVRKIILNGQVVCNPIAVQERGTVNEVIVTMGDRCS